MLSAWMITYSLTITFSKNVTKRLTKAPSLLLGIVVYAASFLVGYWDLNGPVPVFVITHGLLAGVATAFMIAVVSEYLIELTNGENLGLISSFVTTNTKGSVLINQLITFYINPENLPPDISVGRTTFFQQEQVLDRVPSIFLILAGVFAVVHLFGFALIREPKKDPQSECEDNSSPQGVFCEKEVKRDEGSTAQDCLLGKNRFQRYYSDDQHPSISGVSDNTNTDNTVRDDPHNVTRASNQKGGADNKFRVNPLRGTETDTLNATHTDNVPLFGDEFHSSYDGETGERDSSTRNELNIVPGFSYKTMTCLEVEDGQGLFEYSGKTGALCDGKRKSIDSKVSKIEHSRVGASLTWRESLRMREFYIIWFATGSAEITNLVQSSFYKSFGQSIIQDDHFMGSAGTVMCAVLFFSRLFWGIIMDKVMLKTSLVIYFATLSLFGIGWFFSPYIDKWFFLFWNSLLSACAGGMFSVLYYAVFACFGGENFSTMYGLVFSSTTLVSVVLPSVSSALLEHFSWPGLFFCMASINVLTLVLIVICFPRRV
ncbi:uncharacterized protein LOC101857646 [Aplysia californica]|uniref:Uncharacterized protein LOC101857646 n=1 Tax=Aplysia californica TaxID=6500 RepID=A0ABM0JRV4_APLCA|nr:uncharacterized protein LOC101857646 [Aplysia californica]